MFEDNVIDHEFTSSHGREKAPNPEGGPTRREEPSSTVQLRAGESTYRLAVDLQGRTDVGAIATADPLHDVADGTAVRPILRAFRVLAQVGHPGVAPRRRCWAAQARRGGRCPSPSRARCRVERRSSSASRLALRPKPIARRAGLEGPRPRGTVVVSGGTAGRPYPRRMAAAVGRPVARRRRG